MTKDNLTTNASNEPESPAFLVGAVSGSATPNFLKLAVDELLTYRTPKKIIDFQ
jgi:hypothetical protein